MALGEMALLAPVHNLHLQSGLETEKVAGRVAFGCSEILGKLGHDADVFICATHCSSPYPAVTWRAVFIRYTPGVDGAHPDGMKYRPKSTAGEKWKAYWEVSDLKLLPQSEWIPIHKILSCRTGKPYQPYPPQRPYLVRSPA